MLRKNIDLTTLFKTKTAFDEAKTPKPLKNAISTKKKTATNSISLEALNLREFF